MSIDTRGWTSNLHDGAAFARWVKVPRAGRGIVGLALGLSLFALVRNLFATFETDGAARDLDTFLRVFMSTKGSDGFQDIVLTLLVWGPIVLIPVSIAALVWGASTHRARTARTHRDYVERGGYVAEQVPLDITYKESSGSAAVGVVLLTNPGLPPEGMTQLVIDVRRYLGEQLTAKDVTKTLRAAGIAAGAPLSALFPYAPPAVLMVTYRPSEIVVVVPGADGKRAQLLELKQA